MHRRAAAPHAGAVDGFVFLCLGFPRPVILQPYSKIPVVKQILQASGALLVPVQSATKGMKDKAVGAGSGGSGSSGGGTSQTKATSETILHHKRTYDPKADGAAPIVLLAEGA